MSEETNILTLVDEEGKEHRFVLLNVVEMEGKKYAVMVPDEAGSAEGHTHDHDHACEDCGADEEAVVFRIETDENGDEILVDIEDDEEFAKICDLLDEMMLEEDEDSDDPDAQ